METLRTLPSLGARDLTAADLGLTAVTALTTGAPLYCEGRPVTIAPIAGEVIGVLAEVRC